MAHTSPNIQAKRGRRPKPPRTCASCFTTTSSQWRTGLSMETLCNKCGIASRRCQRTGRNFVPVYSSDPSHAPYCADAASSPSHDLPVGETQGLSMSRENSSCGKVSSPASSHSASFHDLPPMTPLLPSFSALASSCLSPVTACPRPVDSNPR
jgi:GATA zinc finger